VFRERAAPPSERRRGIARFRSGDSFQDAGDVVEAIATVARQQGASVDVQPQQIADGAFDIRRGSRWNGSGASRVG